jgi:hypothetical protein
VAQRTKSGHRREEQKGRAKRTHAPAESQRERRSRRSKRKDGVNDPKGRERGKEGEKKREWGVGGEGEEPSPVITLSPL